jgi:hypothetical protein
MRGIATMLCVALPLAAADLYVKATEPTPDWAYHERSVGWLVLSVALFGGMVLIARIPSLLVALAAGLLAGGLLGNALSAAYNHMNVPNPLVVTASEGVVAFNLADVWAFSGICALVLALGAWLIRGRHLHAATRTPGGDRNFDTTSTEPELDRVS